eukprot:2570154-Rhodomonas_salina.1
MAMLGSTKLLTPKRQAAASLCDEATEQGEGVTDVRVCKVDQEEAHLLAEAIESIIEWDLVE